MAGVTKRKRSIHYVNNKEFLAALIAYKSEVADAELLDKPKPRITNYLGECFLKIATHLSYFTQIIHYAFLRRIQKEKKQLEIKNKIIEKNGYEEVFHDDSLTEGGNFSDYNSIKDSIHSKTRYQ